MRFLFIKPKEIGDSLILTPTLRATKRAYPNAEIWVVVRRGCEGILAGCPEIDKILTICGVEKKGRKLGGLWKDIQVIRQLRQTRFDSVFELGDGHRGRLFAIATPAAKRFTAKMNGPMSFMERHRLTAEAAFKGQECHRVEKDFHSVAEFLKLPGPIPKLVFEREYAETWPGADKLTHYGVVQIGSRKPVNRWPRERWSEVIGHLLGRFDQVVITGGDIPCEVEEAEWLCRKLGPRVVSAVGQATWPQVASLLYGARLYVGLNTAAMHLAAACGCPVVALFGRTSEEHWYPWQTDYRIVAGANFGHVTDPCERHQMTRGREMTSIYPAQVIEACDDILAEREDFSKGLESTDGLLRPS